MNEVLLISRKETRRMELRIEQVSKHFKDKEAVNDVSLTLSAGCVGAARCKRRWQDHTMRIIADIMTPTKGKVLYNGTDIRQLGESYRAVFGFLPQDFGYSRDFTVKDYLEYMAALKMCRLK
jgi:ABC-type multidrug transport system ATPase subunit